ncbi:MAG: response regulator [Planctomycetes bacterium]|nr:response regulator [Planctomycetota bacterium]
MSRVLIVEADDKVSRLMREVFTERGCNVDLCSDGRDAFKLAMNADYDLITVNVKIQGMDGCLVVESISMVKPAARIMLVSAAFDSTTNIARAAEKAVAKLSLPLDKGELTDVLEPLGM